MVVDDEPLMRGGLQRILETDENIRVCATCDGGEAVAAALRHRPDVALVDIHMPDVDGVAVLEELRALAEPPVVAMLTGFGSDANVVRALAAGASGFLLKDRALDELIPGVHLLAAGGSALSARVTRAIHAAPRPAQAAVSAAAPGYAALTEREREVFWLLPTGASNEEIGRRLFLSKTTVRDHVSAILAKLGVANRIQAAVLAQSLDARVPEQSRGQAGATPSAPAGASQG
ncbi:response regulator transcription factor [Streptomyces albulus]|uniref:response regulator n=1 Tax=Streptomyces TaxID=1883 RepID=UPI001F467FFD|nr:response regulator transcription factor [Streptomyces noursei]MCE4941561.1 response regulator transcription factor [Streptomyces noursei]